MIPSQPEDEEGTAGCWAAVSLSVKQEVDKLFRDSLDFLEKELSGKARLGESPESSPIDLA